MDLQRWVIIGGFTWNRTGISFTDHTFCGPITIDMDSGQFQGNTEDHFGEAKIKGQITDKGQMDFHKIYDNQEGEGARGTISFLLVSSRLTKEDKPAVTGGFHGAFRIESGAVGIAWCMLQPA